VKVVLLADRGFVHLKAMHMMRTELGWHYRIRLKGNTWIWRAGKGWRQLKDFHLQRGEALCLHTVKLHKQQGYGPVHVALGYNNVNGEFWAIVSDEPTNLQTFREYGLRFDIEEAFLDDQSAGWNLQKSELRSWLTDKSCLSNPQKLSSQGFQGSSSSSSSDRHDGGSIPVKGCALKALCCKPFRV
jgi:hypothetical protein